MAGGEKGLIAERRRRARDETGRGASAKAMAGGLEEEEGEERWGEAGFLIAAGECGNAGGGGAVSFLSDKKTKTKGSGMAVYCTGVAVLKVSVAARNIPDSQHNR